MELISAAALAGMAIVVGRPDLLARGLVRLGVDNLLIVVLGVLVLLGRQAMVDRSRRQPMVSMSVAVGRKGS